MNILFVCTYNRHRSLTAEHILKNKPNYKARSVGTSLRSRRKITGKDIDWADIVFVMESKHEEIIRERFSSQITGKQIICLNIPASYTYMDKELVEILEESFEDYLGKEI